MSEGCERVNRIAGGGGWEPKNNNNISNKNNITETAAKSGKETIGSCFVSDGRNNRNERQMGKERERKALGKMHHQMRGITFSFSFQSNVFDVIHD